MEETIHDARLVRFGTFEVDLRTGELRKAGVKLKFSGQPFQVLAILLERPGEIVTREELQKRLWPETFVDVDHNLNTAINKIREVLGDSAENPRFVETLSRRGYRFIAPVKGSRADPSPSAESTHDEPARHFWTRRLPILSTLLVLLLAAGVFMYRRLHVAPPPMQRSLTRVTFDDGLQIGATWSPDSRFIAYSSDRRGKFDIWVKQLSGGDPVQITKQSGNNWQPDWSPDGKWIAYRSEGGQGGLFIIPALGGAGLERKIAHFGYYPRWSPDSSTILFQRLQHGGLNKFYVASLDGTSREVGAEFTGPHGSSATSAAWHPDGKRVTVWSWDLAPSPSFWTVPIAGGTAVKSEVTPDIGRQLGDVSVSQGTFEGVADFKFAWARSGKAIYFERTFRDARNFWKMTIDPETLRATAIERLTTGPGLDTEPAISPDGKKIAFTEESQHIRAWLFPFDASRGRVVGEGQAVTSLGTEAWQPNLSRDGRKLAFVSVRAGVREIQEKSLSDGREEPVAADGGEYSRIAPQWSPDGDRLVYTRERLATGESQLMLWSSHSREEEPLTALGNIYFFVYGWSADGKWVMVTARNSSARLTELWKLPVAAAPLAQTVGVRVAADAAAFLFQGHFSPDGQWIVFERVRDLPTSLESTLYVMPANGGPWTPITESKYWSDKPVWSPDGKIIYFLSSRQGFLNVWGLHFDAARGKTSGDPFPVTAFNSPSLMVPNNIVFVEVSLTQDRLALTMAQVSGSIWVLGNVDR